METQAGRNEPDERGLRVNRDTCKISIALKIAFALVESVRRNSRRPGLARPKLWTWTTMRSPAISFTRWTRG
jgi:hypothetical protein